MNRMNYNKREFLMLAQPYVGQRVGGWFVSEKLDGVRAYWDGGISRRRSTVPWAEIDRSATGLWSRHGKIIHAPDWWLDGLPPLPLDGELYIGKNKFQETVSAVRKLEPVREEWDRVYFMIIDRVPYGSIFRPGTINSPHFKRTFGEDVLSEVMRDVIQDIPSHPFSRSYEKVRWAIPPGGRSIVIPQEQLPYQDYEDRLAEMMKEVLEAGGEGLILRDPDSYWEPVRSRNMLKMKPYHDAEAEIIGFEPGKGRLEGMVGALIVEWDRSHDRSSPITFKLSGMTDAQREWGFFQPGDIVTFRYRELTKDGVPKEARFWRPREDESS